MQYQIVASDLDGTLFDGKGQVSPENWAAIARMTEKGVHFVPASGRSFGEMPEFLRNCPLIRYYITSDGTTIYDKKTDSTLELALTKELGTWILDELYRFPVCLMVHADVNSYVDADTHTEAHYRRFRMDRRWIDFTFEFEIPKKDFRSFVYGLDAIQMICAFFEKTEDLEICRALFSAHPDLLVVQSYPHNLEILWSKAGKGNALMYLADRLGIPREATIAVGDSTNDATMVQAAGLGLAMENAMEELKHCADAVICSNLEHSAAYIEQHYLR